ncbi:MAG: Asp-tRNA(Asn)/Glu-tRNA(Gln) amidotransferase subunit GatA [Caldisericia bacterium]|nr:Asp-tRNA(Asn)/Glu-tRNA(Gln) amidotransferase subunit GatA [Caldisericia bacterium]
MTTSNTISSIHQQFLSNEKTPDFLFNELLQSIQQKDSSIHAFLHVCEQESKLTTKKYPLPVTKEMLDQYPLLGIPVGVKDNINVQGTETTAASRILKNHQSVYDATVIERMKNRGAYVIGKTNMDEFAMGSSTEFSAYFPTRNPIDLAYTPGGSSGGSAAAVKAGFCTVSLGSDTGGSVRQPASFCGVVGIRPTYGFVSRYGMTSFCSTLDQIGTMGTCVNDAFQLLKSVCGYDEKDSTSEKMEWEDLPDVTPIQSFGILASIERLNMDPFVKKMYDKVVHFLSSSYKPTTFDLNMLDCAMATYHVIADSEASSNLSRFDGIRFGLQRMGTSSEESYIRARTEGFGTEVKRRILLGTYILSNEFAGNYYKQALYAKDLVTQEMESIFLQCPFMIMPTALKMPFKFGERKDPLDMYYSDYLAIPSAIAGVPSVSIPIGMNDKGFSAGIQVIGPRFSEKLLWRIAKYIEEGIS